MKENNLLEMLLTLFEKTLTQLKEAYVPDASEQLIVDQSLEQSTDLEVKPAEGQKRTFEMMRFRSAGVGSTRVFTPEEELKLTIASHQFLKRLERLGVLSSDVMELIVNRLLFSESRFINLQETKWTIRSTLADSLAPEELAFLDLVLYQKEDGLPLH
jgi:Smg protein